MMPPVVLMIPLFKAFVALHLVDGLTGLVVADFFFALPVATWMLRSVFDGIPEEIEEAARVDGCNRLGALTRITLPLALPGVAAAGIFAFIHSWEEYLFARVLISAPDKWIGSIGIASFFGEYHTSWPQVMAAAVIFTLPPVLLFLVVQRRFIDGISGGLKG
jgi:multiple sugar transport system permease protein